MSDDKSIKEEVREVIGEVVGGAVKLGSIIGGTPAFMAEAEAEVAEADTEEFLDRIDGEG